ncbi:YxeA family protein [Lacticaseibacillus hegangensis]|uniref:YxeA family protein n=1 Tax=Lacticaseibacillus hegangensis TaxID=2486010 RepID=A0ABW4CSP7_9LACO|nr:YxeA family protein [Lacticaseibacillus hegangensis]
MKKLLVGLIVVVALAFGGYKLVAVLSYGGISYYTKVTTGGEQITEKSDQGRSYTDYRYRLTGYDKTGHSRLLDFNANKARPLKRGAYLKLVYNANKGVTSWQAVDPGLVPEPALSRLN